MEGAGGMEGGGGTEGGPGTERGSSRMSESAVSVYGGGGASGVAIVLEIGWGSGEDPCRENGSDDVGRRRKSSMSKVSGSLGCSI